MKKMNTKLLYVFPFLFFAVGCGNNTSSSTRSGAIEIRKIGSLEYGVVDGVLSFEGGGISGQGIAIFKNPLPEEDNHFSLNLQLNSSGMVTVTTNSDSKLQSGINITLKRVGDGVTGNMKTGAEEVDISSFFANVDASKPFQFDFEVHPHGHLILMNGNQVEEKDFTIRPTGKFWGVKIQDASLISAALSPVQEE